MTVPVQAISVVVDVELQAGCLHSLEVSRGLFQIVVFVRLVGWCGVPIVRVVLVVPVPIAQVPA